MKAMVLEVPSPIEERPLRLRERPVPEPGPGQILLKVAACGVCHTDLHTAEGDLHLPRLPVIPGHQIVGVVESTGPGAALFSRGDRAGVPWLFETCGRCGFCGEGRENLCEGARFTGYHADGGYAQYTVVSEEFACSLPQSFPDAEAAPLLCGGVIGFRALRLSGVRPGQTLGLYGFGGSAHIAIQVARHWGCTVHVFTRSEEHRALARSLGAAWTGGAGDTPPSALDAAVIFAPAGHLVPEALRVLRRGAAVALAGIHMSPIPSLEYSSLYHERAIRSVANSTREDARELMRLAQRVPIRTEIRVFPLEEANQALLMLKRSLIRGAAVLLPS